MTLKDYLTVARERWLSILLGAALGLGLAGALTVSATPQYAASTNYFIAARDVAGTGAAGAYQGSLLSSQRIKSYVSLAQGRTLREQVAQQLGSPIAQDAITASAQANTVLMTITATDPSPRRAQRIAELAGTVFASTIAELERPEVGQSLVQARLVEAPLVPTVPVSPKTTTNLALGLFLGLLAGIAGAVVRHTLDRSVKEPEQLAEIAGAPLLGVTVWDGNVKSRPLIVHASPRAPLAEAYRQLRTNLTYVDLDNQTKVVCVTSALPHEGKTTTACNLAIAMAQAGNRVLLVEADLRRPSAAANLGVENAVGLTTVLTGRVSLDVAIQPWGDGLLDFLGCGEIPPNPSELLASAQMATLLDELKARYDVIILDTAPVLPVADTPALAPLCDGVLLVARNGWVRTDEVAAAAAGIRRVSAPLLGVVLSMAPRSKKDGGYGYGYVARRDEKTGAGSTIPAQRSETAVQAEYRSR
ncbi:MAG: polysaccharide biosynthesis tyrosine autokinase [Sporichthyaceae bacterium]